MRRLFFYGGRTDHFIATAVPFVQAAGGGRAQVALLFPSGEPGWDVNLDWYRSRMTHLGAEVVPIHPEGDSLNFSDTALEVLRRSTGIFMCGGDTLRYHQVYTGGEVHQLIGSAYRAGIPYGGLSAGALIAPEIGSIWGDRLTTPANRLTLLGSEHGCDDELMTGPALGLLPGCIIECHFSERGGFPRLVAAMEQADVARGIGIDNPICLSVINETEARLDGVGRAYKLRRTGPGAVAVQVFEPGQTFSLVD